MRMYKININIEYSKRSWTEQLLRIKDTRISKSTGQRSVRQRKRDQKEIKQGTSLKWFLTCY